MTIQAHRSPKGIEKTCKTWEIEALKRLLLNCLDPQIAQDRDQLIVYGGTGKAVRHQAAFNTIVTELETLAEDETLLIQSGKPVGKFRTYTSFPRVVASSSMLVPSASNWQTFAELEAKGLTTYGQSTAALGPISVCKVFYRRRLKQWEKLPSVIFQIHYKGELFLLQVLAR